MPVRLIASAGLIKLVVASVLGAILFPADASPVFRASVFSPIPDARSDVTPAESLARILSEAMAWPPEIPRLDEVKVDDEAFANSSEETRGQLAAALAAYRARRPERALDILSRADLEDPNALLLRGLAYLAVAAAVRAHEDLDAPPPGLMTSGIEALSRAASAGQRQAKTYLALRGLHSSGARGGRGPETLLREAAAAGEPSAARLLGLALAAGWINSGNDHEATRFLRQAADSGDHAAAMALALQRADAGDLEAAIDRLHHAAQRGATAAQTVLGIHHLTEQALGRAGETAPAEGMLARAAQAGDLEATYHLGLLYRGIAAQVSAKDPAKAASLFARCAAALHLGCLLAHAEALESGAGAAADPLQAYAVLGLASRGGSEAAKQRLTALKERLGDDELAEARARQADLIARHSRPSPRHEAALLTLRGEARRLSTRGAKAPPPDSLDRLLNATEIETLERLPGLLRAEEGAGKVDRAWHGAVSPDILTRLEEAADLIELGEMSRAQDVVAGLAAQEEPNALYLVALAKTEDPVKPKVRADSLAAMARAADLGHPDAAVQLGHYAWAGKGVPRDAAAARRWYEIGRARGSARASTALGELLISGRWISKDVVAALLHFEDAATGGDTLAMTRLAMLYLDGKETFPDFIAARDWLEKAARAGDREAQWLLAGLVAGDGGGPSDRTAFLRWARAAANQGHPKAMTALGRHYLTESAGTPGPAAARALAWLRGGALRNDPEAQYLFAGQVELGLAAAPDPVKAAMFHAVALRNGYEPAGEQLEHLIPALTCEQLTLAANAYRAFDKIAFWTRGLHGNAPDRRRRDPLRRFEDSTPCAVTAGQEVGGLSIGELTGTYQAVLRELERAVPARD